ncbi:MAG: universal stress protein [Intrasporangiaceae bacterium]|nr:universal stress protein [Intrasporangiaceae bacterium]
MARIVVGIDGSDRARRALTWALGEAQLRQANLDVVHAVSEPLPFADPVIFAPIPVDDLRAEGLKVIDQALTGLDDGRVEIERIAAVGGAARILCEAAMGADLLVVSSRGLGGFRGLLVGSVTQQVVSHAPCPVVVVVPDDRHVDTRA